MYHRVRYVIEPFQAQHCLVIRPVTRGAKTPYKIFRRPWKNVLSIVENYWT